MCIIVLYYLCKRKQETNKTIKIMKKFILNTDTDVIMISIVSIGQLAILILASVSIYCK